MKRTRVFQILSRLMIVALPVTLFGCLSPVQVEPSTTYVLSSKPHMAVKKSINKINLLVAPMDTATIYNTDQIAYTSHPYQVAYFAKSYWAAKPAKMLQSLIIQSLQDTHYFHAVNASPAMGKYDFILVTQLVQLQQDFLSQPSLLRLTVRAQLINARNNSIVATKQFSVIEPTVQNTPYGGVQAANKAVNKVLRQIGLFCMNTI